MKNVKFRVFEPTQNGNYFLMSIQILVNAYPNKKTDSADFVYRAAVSLIGMQHTIK